MENLASVAYGDLRLTVDHDQWLFSQTYPDDGVDRGASFVNGSQDSC
jgi:hypothetical protein